MAGPTSIQRNPRGLLDYLGMKATGVQTVGSEYSAETSGSIDVSRFYMMDRLRGWRSSTGVPPAAVGFLVMSGGIPSAPPAGEAWFVVNASIIVPVIAAATAWRGFFCVERPAVTATVCYEALTDEVDVIASNGRGAGRQFDIPVMINPGDRLGLYTTFITGAPGVQPICSLQFAPIAI